MSYILDALKRADAERERGAVPGLHDHQLARSRDAGQAQPRGSWRLAITVLLALLVPAVGFWVWRDPAGMAPPRLIRPSPPAPPVPSSVAPAAASDAAGASLPLQAMPLPSRPPVRAVAIPAATAPSSAAKAAGAAVASAKPAARTAAPAPHETPPPPQVPAVTRASGPGETLQYSDLPETLRKQIPALNISGVVYAESTHEWILLVNDRLVTRGGFAAADVRLEEVSASSAIFSFRGRRFRIEL